MYLRRQQHKKCKHQDLKRKEPSHEYRLGTISNTKLIAGLNRFYMAITSPVDTFYNDDFIVGISNMVFSAVYVFLPSVRLVEPYFVSLSFSYSEKLSAMCANKNEYDMFVK